MSSFNTIHALLRQMMLEAGANQVIARDEPGNLVLHTGRVDSKTGKPDWFGAVTTKKGYVACYLMALYNDPSLGADMSKDLSKRRQGKSCFNFKSVDTALFAELAEITRKANSK